MLDQKINEIFTEENFMREYWVYKQNKTDNFTKEIKIRMGVDGVDWRNFEKQLEKIARDTCKRIKEGRYFFSPLREVEVPKPPYFNLGEAKKAGEIRILSIATIRDTLVQRLLYKCVEEYCENQFNKLCEDVSFAYRKGKSTHMAIKKIFYYISKERFEYILDTDIKGFFDNIPHDKLFEKIKLFFGEENKILITYLRRFTSTDRVNANDYKKETIFYYKKPKRIPREKGIPQGGVLSGLIANIYMYEFDKYILDNIYYNHGDVKYIRYADDFVVLFKDKMAIDSIYSLIKYQISEMGLELHPLGEKSRKLDLSVAQKDKLEFLGFCITSRRIGIKDNNIIKFKRRMSETIGKIRIYKKSPEKGMEILINMIGFKVLGNKQFITNEKCPQCDKKIQIRNWISYFIVITDVRVLRRLDTWIRKKIYHHYFYRTGKRLTKKMLKKYDIPSLEKEYYRQKKDSFKEEFCKCKDSLGSITLQEMETLEEEFIL